MERERFTTIVAVILGIYTSNLYILVLLLIISGYFIKLEIEIVPKEAIDRDRYLLSTWLLIVVSLS
jgi:adenine specific DNA methylase Mod